MTRSALALALLFALSACADPLRGIARVSDGTPLPAEPGAQALPSEDELARNGSILAGLFGGSRPEVTEAQDRPATPLPDSTSTPVEDTAQAPLNTATDPIIDETIAALVNDQAVANPGVDSVAGAATEPKAKAGLFGWLRQAAQTDETGPAAEPLPVRLDQGDAPVDPSATIPVEASPDLVEPEKRRGLFGPPRKQARKGPDAVDVAPGMVVPFGQIARNCEAKPAKLGKVVDKAARKGRGYVLYDTVPDSTEPRTFYVTGFSDNCPRQFTAALALFGDPAFHEQLRYGLPAEEYPYSTTDKAYEKLKRRVCNVGRSTPCGDRIDRLSRNTTFISAYEKFTDNGRWADMLLHDGIVLAASLKSP